MVDPIKTDSIQVPCFSRCAVSKIDLKGRFVYVDSAIENLLGFSKAELFGRCLLDFVDDSSRRLLEHLLSQRNHYESFFESTRLTFVNKAGDTVAANVIASLNFAAGNPVNFQLIVNTQDDVKLVGEDRSIPFSWPEFYSRLMSLDFSPPWQELVDLLGESGYADTVIVYEMDKDALNPVAATGRGEAEADIKSLPPISDLHRQLIESGREYSYLNEEHVREAVESIGQAPDEFAAPFVINDESPFLLRLVFSDNLSEQQASLSVEQARLLLDHIKWRATVLSSAQSEDPLHTLQFTVGFLDSIGIGAALIDADGQLIGFNPKMAELLKSKTVSGSYKDFCRNLSEFNPPEVESTILRFLATPLDSDDPANLFIQIALAYDVRANLTVIRLSFESNDLSACIIAQPLPGRIEERPLSLLNDADLASLVKLTRTQICKISRSSQKLKGDLSGRTNKGLARRASNLARDVTELDHVHSELARVLELTSQAETACPVDLSSLIHGILIELNSSGPKLDLACKCEGLPTVLLRRDKTASIFRLTLSAIATLAAKEEFSLVITAQVDAEVCRIRVIEDQNGLAKVDLNRAISADREPSAALSEIDSMAGFELSLAAALAKQLNGQIEMQQGAGGLTELVVTLPISHD